MARPSPLKVASQHLRRLGYVTYEVWGEEELRQMSDDKGVPGASQDSPDTPTTRDLRKVNQAPEKPTSSFSVGLDVGTVEQDTPSARVRPEGNDFDNDYPWQFKRAFAVVQDIMDGVPGEIRQKSESYQPRLLKKSILTGRMTFEVGDWKVRVRVKNPKSTDEMKLRLKCDCPFWRYYGPDFWAKQQKYLEGKPAGKATYPDVRDPGGRNGLCKHATAVVVHLLAQARKR